MVLVKTEVVERPATEAEAAAVLQLIEKLGHRVDRIGQIRIYPDARGAQGMAISVEKAVVDESGRMVRA